MKRGYIYLYRVVASNGAGIYGTYKRCDIARTAMAKIAEGYPLPDRVFEIERVREFGSYRQYQMRSGSRWVEWNPKRDHTVRKPDWTAVSPEKQEAS